MSAAAAAAAAAAASGGSSGKVGRVQLVASGTGGKDRQVPGSLAMRSELGGHASMDRTSKAAEILRTLPEHIADKILAGLRRTRTSPAEAFAAIDTNGDGLLQPDEFASGLRALQVDMSEAQYKVVFSKFDEDGNGSLDMAVRRGAPPHSALPSSSLPGVLLLPAPPV
eukprot:SAG22_NODE_112_length_19423_cov_11.462223_11_plen_168_part_00